MAKNRILFISNLFPNPLSPDRATYNRQQLSALQEYYGIDVIAPIAWTDMLRQGTLRTAADETCAGIYHPVYWYPPGCFRSRYGEFFYHSIKSVAGSLLERHKYDLIFSSWLYPDGWAAARLAEQFRLPLFVKVHGTDVNRLTTGSKLAQKSLSVTRAAQKVICVSKALQDRLLELGCEAAKPVVVYNGINRDIFHPRPRHEARLELGINQAEQLVLFVGNLKKDKGLAELIAAFATMSESAHADEPTRLAIIGTGPYLPELKRLMALLPDPGKVILPGVLPLERIAVWMCAASVVCLPSYMEGVPNVVLEALACGTPVVATSVGGIPELDRGDGSLVLVEPRSVSELAKALQLMLNRGDRAVSSNFISSWQESAAQLHEIFDQR